MGGLGGLERMLQKPGKGTGKAVSRKNLACGRLLLYTAYPDKLRLEDSVAMEWESLVTRETKFSFLGSQSCNKRI